MFPAEPKVGLLLILVSLMLSLLNGIREDVLEHNLVLVGVLNKLKIFLIVQDSNKPICNKLKNALSSNGLMDIKVLVASAGLLDRF